MKCALEGQALTIATIVAIAMTVICIALNEVAVNAADRCNASCRAQGRLMLVYSISWRGETSCECARGETP